MDCAILPNSQQLLVQHGQTQGSPYPELKEQQPHIQQHHQFQRILSELNDSPEMGEGHIRKVQRVLRHFLQVHQLR